MWLPAAVSISDSSVVTLGHADIAYAVGVNSSTGGVGISGAGNAIAITLDNSKVTGSTFDPYLQANGIIVAGDGNMITANRSRIDAFGSSVLAVLIAGNGNSVSLNNTTVTTRYDRYGTYGGFGGSYGATGVEVGGDNNDVTLNRTSIDDDNSFRVSGRSNTIKLNNSTIASAWSPAVQVFDIANTVTLTGSTIKGGNFGVIVGYTGNTVTVDATTRITAARECFGCESSTGVAVYGDNNLFVNRGAIAGDVGVNLRGLGDGNTFVNSGVVTGHSGTAILLEDYGSNRVILQTGSVISGDIKNNSFGNASMTLQGGGSLTSNVYDFRTLTMEGPGAWVLGGYNAFTSGATVTGGTLVANGTLASPVTINAGGTLAGTGTVGSVTANAGSTVAPGNPGGVLTVNGNVTLNPGARLQVGIAPRGSKSALNASGTASFGGASAQVLADPGTYQVNTRYSVLSASGGILGTFAGVTAEGASPFLAPALSYDPNNVYLTLNTNFMSAAITPNQRAVAGYLDRVAGDAGMQSLVGRLLGMSVPQAPPTFASMDGELHASLSTAMLNQGSQALRRLGGRLAILEGSAPTAAIAWSGLKVAGAAPAASDMPPPYAQSAGPAGLGFTGPGFWIQGVGDFSNVDGDPNAAGYRYRSGGVATGVDAQVAVDTYLGASFSYLSGSMTLDGRNDSGNVNSPQIGLYASHRSGDLSVKAIAGYAWNRYGTSRTVQEGNSVAIARGNYNGGETSAYLEGAYTLPHFDRSVQPVIALQGVWLSQDGFTENGAGAASLRVAEQNPHSLVSYLGSRFFPVVNESARVELRALWAHEFADTSLAINGSMVGASTLVTFTTTGVSLPRDAAVLGAGLVAKPYAKLSLFLDYNATLNSQQTTQTVVGGLRYVW